MKQVEQLKTYYRFDSGMTNTDLFSKILNDCPNLKKFVVNLPYLHIQLQKRVGGCRV